MSAAADEMADEVQRCYMRLTRSALLLAGYAPYHIAHIVRH